MAFLPLLHLTRFCLSSSFNLSATSCKRPSMNRWSRLGGFPFGQLVLITQYCNCLFNSLPLSLNRKSLEHKNMSCSSFYLWDLTQDLAHIDCPTDVYWIAYSLWVSVSSFVNWEGWLTPGMVYRFIQGTVVSFNCFLNIELKRILKLQLGWAKKRIVIH